MYILKLYVAVAVQWSVLSYMALFGTINMFKFVYGHAEAFITELRIEHSLQSNFVRFLCDLKLGQALYPRLNSGLRPISA